MIIIIIFITQFNILYVGKTVNSKEKYSLNNIKPKIFSNMKYPHRERKIIN